MKPILLENLYIKVNKNNLDQKLRYNDGGNVHMDFHGATNTTIEFIINKYGIDTMNDIFKKVGNNVYKDIKDHIKNCLLYTSPSPRDRQKSRMPSSA